MKLRHILKALASSPLPPTMQGPIGSKADQEWASGSPSIIQTLLGWGSDNKVYSLPPADQRRLRPILLRDERALKNEAIARERARRRGDTPLPVNFAQDAPQIDGNQGASIEAAFPDVPDGIRRMMLQRDPSGFVGYGASASSFTKSPGPGDVKRG
jgi:hypothetical protein